MTDLTTPTCERLGIKRPIVQAPVSTTPDVIAGVSNAGGLGVLQATWLNNDSTSDIVAAIQRRTNRPFAANYVISLMDDDVNDNFDYVLEVGVPVISTFWGDPAPLVPRIHDAGALAMHTVGSAEEARRVVDAGVDIVVAQGVEAGGHVWGEVSTLVLVPAVVDAVPDAHVIAAGGIADGRGLAAVLSLGAGAAWIGTRFVMSKENKLPADYSERMLAAKETDTLYSSLFDIGWPDAPHRVLVNETVQAWIDAGRPPPGERPNEGDVLAHHPTGEPILRYSTDDPYDGMTGDLAAMCLYAGQSIGLINDEKPVADIVDEIVSDAANIISRIGNS